jgi:hypothetical protein
MASAKNGNPRPAKVKDLGGDDVAQIIARLQDVSIPSGTRAGTAGDLLRINDTVKVIAGDRLDFFDVPANFARVMKGMS